MGVDVGRLVLPARPPVFTSIKSPKLVTFLALGICSAISTIAFYSLLYFGFNVSRRFVSP
jgi:hypothetical protein